MNLRELTEDQESILAQVESGDFNLDDVSDHLDMLQEVRNKKIESYLHVINRIEDNLNSISGEINRLISIKEMKGNALANIKSWLLSSMKDGEKHEFDLFKVTRVKGREVVSITDKEILINEGYGVFKETITVDKKLILSDLKLGMEIKGAEITTGNPSLRIK